MVNMPDTRTIELHIVLQSTTPNVRGGVQVGSGSSGEVRDWQETTGETARFVAIAQVRDGQLPLRGDAIQKDGKGRFVYIVWRDDSGIVSRRAKIYVEGIDQAMLGDSDRFEVLLPGKARDGLPCCATVTPVRGWRPLSA